MGKIKEIINRWRADVYVEVAFMVGLILLGVNHFADSAETFNVLLYVAFAAIAIAFVRWLLLVFSVLKKKKTKIGFASVGCAVFFSLRVLWHSLDAANPTMRVLGFVLSGCLLLVACVLLIPDKEKTNAE